jgi:UDP-N-acetylglucosamine--N-acetylmuramyl-(pentapeptide) pyrophosphoryl-undecaprenol N-acetylglucosamine transferase
MTLSEVSECGVVPILIPSPNVTNDHQYKNAKIFTDSGAALMIEEHELNDRTLLDAVRYLITNRPVREKMKKSLLKFRSDDTKSLIYKAIKDSLKR